MIRDTKNTIKKRLDYKKPSVQIVSFDVDDIIRTSIICTSDGCLGNSGCGMNTTL